MITLKVEGPSLNHNININENLTNNNIKAFIQYESFDDCDIVCNREILSGHMTIREAKLKTGDKIEVL